MVLQCNKSTIRTSLRTYIIRFISRRRQLAARLQQTRPTVPSLILRCEQMTRRSSSTTKTPTPQKRRSWTPSARLLLSPRQLLPGQRPLPGIGLCLRRPPPQRQKERKWLVARSSTMWLNPILYGPIDVLLKKYYFCFKVLQCTLFAQKRTQTAEHLQVFYVTIFLFIANACDNTSTTLITNSEHVRIRNVAVQCCKISSDHVASTINYMSG